MANVPGDNGNNSLSGTGDRDTISGFGGSDTLSGFNNNDLLQGGNDNDNLFGGEGDDTLDGGFGVDLAFYIDPGTQGITVDLAAGTVIDQHGDRDTLIAVEGVVGTDFRDRMDGSALGDFFSGNLGNDVLNGGAGNDTLLGGSGSDTLDGGAGNDSLDGGTGLGDKVTYATASSGVNVSLATGQATGGGGTDTLNRIENVDGSNFNDIITGSAGNNVLFGGLGSDILEGGGGNDTVDGGAGIDNASYVNATAGVTIDLATRTARGTFSDAGVGVDTLVSIENSSGSSHADVLSGSVSRNELFGGGGNDTLMGQGGNDHHSGGAGNDLMIGGTGNDTYRGGTGFDRVRFEGNDFGKDTMLEFFGEDQIELRNVVGFNGQMIDDIRDIDADGNGRIEDADTGVSIVNGDLHVAFAGGAEIIFDNMTSVSASDWTIL